MSVIIYTRTSTSKQEVSHDVQEEECRKWARSNGLEVIAVFNDTLSGSTELCDRDGFCNALELLGKDDILCVYRRDRLGRDAIQNAVGDKLVKSKGASLHSLDVGTATTAEQILMQTILDAFAQYERAIIVNRIKVAMKKKKEQGYCIGTTPLGQSKDEEGKLIDNQEEQIKIELIRFKRKGGMTFDQLIQFCIDENICSRRGTPVSRPTIERWCKGIKLPRTRKSKVSKRKDQNPELTSFILPLHEEGRSVRQITNQANIEGFTTSKGNPLRPTQIQRIIYKQVA
jgi:DNA invertase Pin-like site-specific DNA recombinase